MSDRLDSRSADNATGAIEDLSHLPLPTWRDRLIYSLVALVSLVVGILCVGGLFALITPLLRPTGFDAVVQPAIHRAALGGSLGPACLLMLIALDRWLARRYRSERDRRIVDRMLRRRRASTEADRAAIAQSLDRWMKFEDRIKWPLMIALTAAGLYLWVAFSIEHVGVRGDRITWRTSGLAYHERPMADVERVVRSAERGKRGRAGNPFVTITFKDAQQARAKEAVGNDANCDRLADLIASRVRVVVERLPPQ